MKWICKSCERICSTGDILRAANPFDKEKEIIGCPVCKEIGEIVAACDEPGCRKVASNGWSDSKTKTYRHTCYNHSIFKEESK